MLSAGYAPALRRLLPPNARRLVQFGCGDGALAAAYKHSYPASLWIGVEREAEAAKRALRFCDQVHQANADTVDASLFAHLAMSEVWIFDQTLQLSAAVPQLLRRIRAVLAADACLAIVTADPAGLASVLAQCGYQCAAPQPLADAAGAALLLASPA